MAKADSHVNVAEPSADTVDDTEILSLIALALRRGGVKHSYAAGQARVKESQFSGALNGHGAFNARWLWNFPTEFWNEFLPMLRAHKEASDHAKQLQRKERLIEAIELLLIGAA